MIFQPGMNVVCIDDVFSAALARHMTALPVKGTGERMSDLLRVELENGKYTVVQDEGGHLHALRHGEPWRLLTGDNLILALAQEVERLRQQVHNFCHDKHSQGPVTAQEFCDGCEAFQITYFGKSPIKELREERDALKMEYESRDKIKK